MKPQRGFTINRKGISTILAALLMVVIVVVASVMVYAWSTGLLGSLLVTPTAGKEALSLETSTFPTSTTCGSYANCNATLYIRNTGTATVTFMTYYVKDSSGDTYTQSSWTSGPTIAPNQVGIMLIGVNLACGCGTVSGTDYTFQSGSSYTVTVVTSRNNQFVFTVTR